MAGIKLPKILKNFNLMVDGRGQAGRADAIQLPALAVVTEEHRGGGMDAPVKIDVGMEALDLSFTMAEYSSELLSLFGIKDQAPTQLTFRGALDDDQGNVESIVVNARGKIINADPDEITPGAKNTIGYTVNCVYLRIEIGGVVTTEIDIANGRRIIGGVDQLAEVRAALQI